MEAVSPTESRLSSEPSVNGKAKNGMKESLYYLLETLTETYGVQNWVMCNRDESSFKLEITFSMLGLDRREDSSTEEETFSDFIDSLEDLTLRGRKKLSYNNEYDINRKNFAADDEKMVDDEKLNNADEESCEFNPIHDENCAPEIINCTEMEDDDETDTSQDLPLCSKVITVTYAMQVVLVPDITTQLQHDLPDFIADDIARGTVVSDNRVEMLVMITDDADAELEVKHHLKTSNLDEICDTDKSQEIIEYDYDDDLFLGNLFEPENKSEEDETVTNETEYDDTNVQIKQDFQTSVTERCVFDVSIESIDTENDDHLLRNLLELENDDGSEENDTSTDEIIKWEFVNHEKKEKLGTESDDTKSSGKRDFKVSFVPFNDNYVYDVSSDDQLLRNLLEHKNGKTEIDQSRTVSTTEFVKHPVKISASLSENKEKSEFIFYDTLKDRGSIQNVCETPHCEFSRPGSPCVGQRLQRHFRTEISRSLDDFTYIPDMALNQQIIEKETNLSRSLGNLDKLLWGYSTKDVPFISFASLKRVSSDSDSSSGDEYITVNSSDDTS